MKTGANTKWAKTAAEWCRYVVEAAKMMKQVDPFIELVAASARYRLEYPSTKGSWSILGLDCHHHYWDKIWTTNDWLHMKK